MKLFILLIFSLSIQATAAEYEGSHFKGYVQVNKVTFERVLQQNEIYELGNYLGESYSFFSGGLLRLLGYLPSGQNNGDLVNAIPNPINTLLYHIIFDNLSRDMSIYCSYVDDPNKARNYQDHFLPHLKALCEAPLNEALAPELLYSLWNSILIFDAPQSEFKAWKDYIAAETFSSKEERTYKTIYPIFMNPYFLIEN